MFVCFVGVFLKMKRLKAWQRSAKLDTGTYETFSKLKIQSGQYSYLTHIYLAETLWINTQKIHKKAKLKISIKKKKLNKGSLTSP